MVYGPWRVQGFSEAHPDTMRFMFCDSNVTAGKSGALLCGFFISRLCYNSFALIQNDRRGGCLNYDLFDFYGLCDARVV